MRKHVKKDTLWAFTTLTGKKWNKKKKNGSGKIKEGGKIL